MERRTAFSARIVFKDYRGSSVQRANSGWERHKVRKAELAGRYGPPIKIERTLASLADAIEAALKSSWADRGNSAA